MCTITHKYHTYNFRPIRLESTLCLECLHLWEGLKVYLEQFGTTYSIHQVGDGRMTFAFVRGVTGDLPIVIAVWSGGRRASRKICCIRNKSECLDSADVGHRSDSTRGDSERTVITWKVSYSEGQVSLPQKEKQNQASE
jgi:hypothetical protein